MEPIPHADVPAMHDGHRARPSIFQRDYWPLAVIRRAVDAFFAQHGEHLRGGLAVDLGCGNSPYAAIAAAGGFKLLAADIGARGPDSPVIAIDEATGRVDLPDGAVDAVLSTQVLEHVADVQQYLREAVRILRPGGLLFCSTHGAFILHRHPTDFRRWTVDGLKYELEQAGFVIDRLEPRLGILAMSSHLRSIAFGGLTRRIPMTGWLRPLIYCFFNLRMAIEEKLTPDGVMEAHPELLIAVARKPAAPARQRPPGRQPAMRP